MARGSLQVTYRPADEGRIPDILTEGTALLIELRRRGVLEAVGERLHVRRQGGYSGIDIWILLLLFFAAGATRGVRKFWGVLCPVVRRVAGVAGRRRLPSSSSLSRALAEPGTAREDRSRSDTHGGLGAALVGSGPLRRVVKSCCTIYR